MTLHHLALTCPFNPPSLQSFRSVQPSAVPYCSGFPLRFRQTAWATWQQPLELVSITAMYSTPFSRLSSRAANFLLLGYTNCSISILYWAAAGSWSSTRHWWPVPAILITTPQRPFVSFFWDSQTHAASICCIHFAFPNSYPDPSVKLGFFS